ncbi:hypothetical protein EAG_16313 [Camponotus floridanus]|uniref:Uncharacterized protein n=1 Tax=Camponotus floridanus TaxID=104421 RepID=E2A6K0_CAMFO|nr:hypothetical protein EAG_16313 [Camponotus floridanus]
MVDDCCYLEPALKNAMRNTVILKAPDIFIERERALAQKKFDWNPDDSIFNSKRRNNQTRCSLSGTCEAFPEWASTNSWFDRHCEVHNDPGFGMELISDTRQHVRS